MVGAGDGLFVGAGLGAGVGEGVGLFVGNIVPVVDIMRAVMVTSAALWYGKPE